MATFTHQVSYLKTFTDGALKGMTVQSVVRFPNEDSAYGWARALNAKGQDSKANGFEVDMGSIMVLHTTQRI